MDAMQAEGKTAVALNAYRLLALTGAQLSEIMALKVDEVRLDESIFEFQDTKTGKQNRKTLPCLAGRAAVAA
ncbi:MAG: hypothetical protein WD767_19550 [Alphaproteobacteria bacterium]